MGSVLFQHLTHQRINHHSCLDFYEARLTYSVHSLHNARPLADINCNPFNHSQDRNDNCSILGKLAICLKCALSRNLEATTPCRKVFDTLEWQEKDHSPLHPEITVTPPWRQGGLGEEINY